MFVYNFLKKKEKKQDTNCFSFYSDVIINNGKTVYTLKTNDAVPKPMKIYYQKNQLSNYIKMFMIIIIKKSCFIFYYYYYYEADIYHDKVGC